MPIYPNFYQTLSACPIVELRGYAAACGLKGRLYAYLDFAGPTGTARDGLAEGMLALAIEKKKLISGQPIIEAASGPFAAALTLAGLTAGHPVVLVMPEDAPALRQETLLRLGAQIRHSPARSGVNGARRLAAQTAAANGWYYMDWLANDDNPEYHRRVTGPAIVQSIAREGKSAVDAIVIGVGSGGTVTGVGETIKAWTNDVRIAAVEPYESQALGGGLTGPHGISDLGYGFVPENFNAYVVDNVVAVNTTAGTASEITRFCIITDTARKVKMCIVDWRVTPAIAINDPELMVGMPSSLTAATGMDALTHAVEAYVSTDANPLTDAAAIKAIDKIVHYLPQAVANGDYMKARSEMAYAQYLAGVAFNNASLGYVHAMAHQLGGYYNLPHGVCNAILLPYVQEFNLIGNLERFAVIAKAMDLNVDGMSPFEAGEACVYGLKTFGRYLGIPQNLRSLGVDPADFEVMAENAMKDACAATNPRKATKDQIIAIFQKAYDGD